MENGRFNYIIKQKGCYSALPISLPCWLEQAMCTREEGKSKPKRPPSIAVNLLLHIIGKTQLINSRNDGTIENMYHVTSSVRKIAEETRYAKNTVQTHLTWLKDHGWLEIIAGKGNSDSTYKIPIEKINEVILCTIH